MVGEMQHMSLRDLSDRTEAFVTEMIKPLEHYGVVDSTTSTDARKDMRGLYAQAFVQLMRHHYIIDD